MCWYTFDVFANIGTCLSIIENIALNKPAWQQYPYHPFLGMFDADRAVDGYKSNLDLFGGHCTFSDYEKSTAEWGVDLGRVLSIHYIFIQYATNNDIWGTDLKML